MNKKSYMASGICGAACFAFAVIAWIAYFAAASASSGSDTSEALGLAIISMLLIPLSVENAAILLVIAGLSTGAFVLIKSDKRNRALLISLGVFELVLAAPFAFFSTVIFDFPVLGVLFGLAALISVAAAVITFVFAAKLVSPGNT